MNDYRYEIRVYEDYILIYGTLTVNEFREISEMYCMYGYCYIGQGKGSAILGLYKEMED